jgi:hypothetical protein
MRKQCSPEPDQASLGRYWHRALVLRLAWQFAEGSTHRAERRPADAGLAFLPRQELFLPHTRLAAERLMQSCGREQSPHRNLLSSLSLVQWRLREIVGGSDLLLNWPSKT